MQRETKVLTIVTVNDVDKFSKLLSGALFSRHPERIYFARPGREVMTAILTRDIKLMGGDLAWIAPTLDFADEMGIEDVREVQSICLCGREMLLTGEWQDVMRATSAPAADAA